jgi:hypothetical protein
MLKRGMNQIGAVDFPARVWRSPSPHRHEGNPPDRHSVSHRLHRQLHGGDELLYVEQEGSWRQFGQRVSAAWSEMYLEKTMRGTPIIKNVVGLAPFV